MNFHEQINNLSYLKGKRKYLRSNLTLHEALLWKFIKSEQLSGLKFRRQFSVGNYILDFYCAEFRLAIELDGNYHFSEEGIIKDQIRDEFLQKLNITVLRIENELVLTRMETVLSLILEKIEQLKTPPSR